VATLSPFYHSSLHQGVGGVNLEGIEEYFDCLMSDHVDGLWLNGTSGESMSLGVDERIEVVDAWCQVKASKYPHLPIIVHVAALSVSDSIKMAQHSNSKKEVDGIACMAPCFFKPNSISELLEFLVPIANAAPDKWFMYYHFPAITGVDFPVHKVLPAASEVIPTLIGAKYTGSDLGDVIMCLSKGYNMLMGNECMILPAHCVGVHGSVGIAYSVFAPFWKQIVTLYDSGDLEAAKKQQIEAAVFHTTMREKGTLQGGYKALMKEVKCLDLGPVRPPLPSLSSHHLHQFILWFKSTSLYNYTPKH